MYSVTQKKTFWNFTVKKYGSNIVSYGFILNLQ